MAVRLVSSVPPVSILHRIWTSLKRLAGALLIFAGSVSSLLVILVVITLFTEGNFGDDNDMLGPFLVASLLTFGGIPLGRRLMRGRRSLVLYLRKFGFTSSTNVLTFAISTAVGKTWRLVTLDDSHTEPVTMSRRKRLFYGLTRWGLTIGLVALIWRFIAWLKGDEAMDGFEDTFNESYESAQESGQGCFQAFVGAFIGTAFLYMILFLFMIVFFMIGFAILGSFTVFSWSTVRAINKAEKSKAFDIETKDQVMPQISKIDRISKKIFAPRLIIAHVADTIWREVIKEIDRVTDYIIIDVSNPTKHLIWEITTIRRQPSNQVVYVGHAPSLQFIQEPATATEHQLELMELLQQDMILTYQGQDDRSMQTFARSLRALLDRKGH